MEPPSPKPLVFIELLRPWPLASLLELNKEHSTVGRDKEPIWCVAFMELVDQVPERYGRFY